MITIPWFDASTFVQEITLDDVPFLLSMYYVSRAGFWTLSISDRDQNELLTGQRLVLGGELLRQYPTQNLPKGMMFVIDETGNSTKILQNDFLDGRIKLLYASEAEVESF